MKGLKEKKDHSLRMNASVYFSDYSLFSVAFSGLLTAKNMAKEIDKKAHDLQY